MKVSSIFVACLASIFIVAFVLTGCNSQQKSVGQDIAGQWRVVHSTARFKISFAGGDIRIAGWDSDNGEKFVISNVKWDGKRLKGTFTMPSTGHTTYSDLLLIDENTLKGAYKGDTSSGEEVWLRQ